MVPKPDYEDLLRRRRIWGVPPDAVEELAAGCERAQADLRARLTALEEQLATARAEREAMQQTVVTLQGEMTHLEQEKDAAANRPEAVREEAVRFVVDAWIEAQTLRDQTQREIETAQAAAQQEVTKVRQEVAQERQRHEAVLREERERHEADMRAARQRYETEITALHERRQRAVADLESLAESLLHQTGRDEPAIGSSAAATTESDVAAPPEPPSAPPEQPPAPIAHPVMNGTPHTASNAAEDELLVKALDELEAILSSPRKGN